MENNTGSVRVKIQKFGSFLSGMIMPNIGAFIAWGILATLFIPTGWIPNEQIAEMVDPMLRWGLPMLVAYTSGYNVYKQRGGVIAVISSLGAIIGAEMPMFLAVMIISPTVAFIQKKADSLLDGKIKPGFEMLVNSFVIGILGAIFSVLSYFAIGPVIEGINLAFMGGVEWLIDNKLFPLVAIIAEPAKVLFLNNALYHGVVVPLAMNQVMETGKSVLFMTIANQGPGLGVLLAYMFFGRGTAKQSAPGAIVIHFLGGIHEMYFPYVLMNPLHLVSIIVSGAVGLWTFDLFDAGLVAAPSPGSIFAILAMTERNSFIGIIVGTLISTIIAFVLSSLVVKFQKKTEEELQPINMNSDMEDVTEVSELPSFNNIKNIVFACDAGMGSSAMGASLLRKKIKENNLDIDVKNYSIANIPDNVDLIITHKDLTDRAKQVSPNSIHVSVENFLSSDKYDEVIKKLLANK
ncbi:PTS mannitol transporter subunit IICB [Enterococcus olivae]